MSDYWQQRNKILNDKILDEAYKDVPNLEKQYTNAIADIDKQIRSWYQKLADNNGVSFAEAKKLLSKDELKEFHWTVEEYIAHGQDLSGAWTKELRNASARVHISRLEALKMQLRQHAEELTGKRLKTTQNAAETAFTESYYHTAFETQKAVGTAFNLHKIDKRELEAVLSKPWTADDLTFSERIWSDRDRLVDVVNKEITRMVATGAKPDGAIDAIMKAFNASKANASRVVMTESAYSASVAHKKCFEDLEAEEFEIVGTFDTKMCEDCAELDGTHLPMSAYEPGVTAPPFHPWCRCTTVVYNERLKGLGERWMRDPETGKGDSVPDDMTYQEWKDIYVDKKYTFEEWENRR